MVAPDKSAVRVVHLSSAHRAHDNRIFSRECRFLSDLGYRVTFIVPHERDEVIDNVHIRAVPMPVNRKERISRTVAAIYRAAITENAELYHFHDPELIPVALLLLRRGKKVVYDVHEDHPSTIRYSRSLPSSMRSVISWSFGRVERYAARRFSALIGANPEITRRISRFNSLTLTIGNYPALKEYPSPPRFHPTRYSAGVLVSFGGISSRTCAKAIVQALELVPANLHPTLLLGGKIYGDGSLAEVSRMPGWSLVRYLKEIPVPDMLQQLLASSLEFVLFSPEPNHFGVGSNRFYEALAAGLPVVTSNFPNWKEIVNRLGCGVAVEPTDPRAIADAVIYLLSNPAAAAEMGRRAYAAAREEFNWERESGKLQLLYSVLLEGHGTSGETRPTERNFTSLTEAA